MKIVFMGTPDFAKESLEAIYNAGHEILAVVTNVDKPKGRGMKMIPTPVKEFALEKELPIYQPLKVRNNEEFINEMKDLKPDLFCVVAYGKILPAELLDIPKYGSINVHGSLLPKYRGAAPIQRAVLDGEKVTGVTTMFMDIGMDTGDMILKEETEIGSEETTGELWDRLSTIGAKLLVETVKKIEEAVATGDVNSVDELKVKIGAEKQGDNFTVAPMLDKEMSFIDWNKSAFEIHNLIRGLNPIMGCVSFYEGKKIKIWKATIVSDFETEGKENGEIVRADKGGLYVKTADGVLSLLELQPENSKRMDYKSFLNGNKIEVGKILKMA